MRDKIKTGVSDADASRPVMNSEASSVHDSHGAIGWFGGVSGLRLVEIALSGIGMVALSPIYLIIYILLKVEEPGSVIYSQGRIGKNGRTFDIYKFRKFPKNVTGGLGITIGGDSRMTPLGAILERTKLDEIPQLWNVFIGDMSFVGWRPESLKYSQLYTGEFAEILAHRPGILGPFQVKYRTESDLYPVDHDPEEYYVNVIFPKKARMDLEYLRGRSAASDFVLLVKGVLATLTGMVNWRRFIREKGAYLAFDAGLITLSWYLAHLVRFSGVPATEHMVFVRGLYTLPAVTIAMMLIWGCYKSIHEYISLRDLIKIASVVLLSSTISFTLLVALNRTASIYVMAAYAAIALNILIAPRLYMRARTRRRKAVAGGFVKSVIIYGANSLTALLIGWTHGEKSNRFKIEGIVSNDASIHGKSLEGAPVIGGVGQLHNLMAMKTIDEVWLLEPPDWRATAILNQLAAQYSFEIVDISATRPFAHIFNPSAREDFGQEM